MRKTFSNSFRRISIKHLRGGVKADEDFKTISDALLALLAVLRLLCERRGEKGKLSLETRIRKNGIHTCNLIVFLR